MSVVVPTYHRREPLARLLRALVRQTWPAAAFEVIVSVDGSEDGTREMVQQTSVPFHLTCLWQPNRGRAAACNAGLQAAQGAVVVLLDDDMEPAPELLAAHWRAHAKQANLGIMGAVPICLTDSARPVEVFIGEKFNRHLANLASPTHQMTLRDFYSGNFSIQRQALLAAGGFDEDFRVYGNEDLELSIRLTQAGIRLVYCAEALAYQHYGKDFAALARDNMAKGQTARLLVSKHPETFPQLKLSTYAKGSAGWRLGRALLLWFSRLWPGTPQAIIAGVSWLERMRFGRMGPVISLTLDYCYWLGAQTPQAAPEPRGLK